MATKVNRLVAKLAKRCLVCGTPIRVSVSADRRYRGGHYFGLVPLGRFRKNVEYWECPTCYRSPAKKHQGRFRIALKAVNRRHGKTFKALAK